MVKFEVDDRDLQKSIKIAVEKCNDLTIPFTLMVQSWFKSNRSIFQLGSPGKYDDYVSPTYPEMKQKKYGFIYPMLKATGRLEASITKPESSDSINYIINKKTLILGSSVPYGIYHQSSKPRKTRLPRRPFILLGPEQVAPDGINRRAQNWAKLLQDYVLQSAGVQ